MRREEIQTGFAGTVEHAVPEEAEELWTEDGAEHVGWFCVRTDPFPCPAPGCSFVAVFMTAAHLVLEVPARVADQRLDAVPPPRARARVHEEERLHAAECSRVRHASNDTTVILTPSEARGKDPSAGFRPQPNPSLRSEAVKKSAGRPRSWSLET